ncbi:flagellar biosynthetic protein FliR [Allosphingosinicella deserti]|uniref:Type III secretion protein n=1 Tax=Allosphingosinicella deserti TaxID=2116704 RepID=A0A2P7QW43_9SPHN|nr:flagellar biosynthetic protein FliR [Sphingomonas deserti]PSJ42191.1 type III secretion protein [Sphingomonas deserti]
MEQLAAQGIAALLVSLRIVPTFAFAPPFTFVRVPGLVRLLLSVSLAAWLVAGHPGQAARLDVSAGGLLVLAAAELLTGLALSLSLMLAFAALQTAGRAVDIQAGFGLATLVDPTTRAQMPLVGTLFAYAAGVIFFATGGPADLLALWSASLDQLPLGGAFRGDVGALTGYLSAVFVLAFGTVGLIMLVLFLIDLAVAFMSRTMPQMNVLLFGFQVKTLVTLLLLPITVALATSLLLRMLRLALDTALI